MLKKKKRGGTRREGCASEKHGKIRGIKQRLATEDRQLDTG